MKCIFCGKKFKKYRPQHIFCSYKCNDAFRYYKDRNKRLVKDKAYYEKHKKKWIEKFRKAREKYPEKYRARNKLRYAVFMGKIKRLPCEVCGNEKSHAHHDDYLKPFEVRWVCSKHHGELHRKYGK